MKRAVVFGSSGAIGKAIVFALEARGAAVCGFARSGSPSIDITFEEDVIRAAELAGTDLDAVIVASGFLHDEAFSPEKALRRLDPVQMIQSISVNAIGPSIVMKHFSPRLTKERASIFAVLSARVGSIEDNRLGGWHSYRAAKAALNQIVRTVSIELARTHPKALCVALHPGTVDTPLSAPFHKDGTKPKSPATAAAELLTVLDNLRPEHSGKFFDYAGKIIPF
jgi:NAD(P)-dependent dehydrogenase (short-subunit alcohol dehydrogenase family)